MLSRNLCSTYRHSRMSATDPVKRQAAQSDTVALSNHKMYKLSQVTRRALLEFHR